MHVDLSVELCGCHELPGRAFDGFSKMAAANSVAHPQEQHETTMRCALSCFYVKSEYIR